MGSRSRELSSWGEVALEKVTGAGWQQSLSGRLALCLAALHKVTFPFFLSLLEQGALPGRAGASLLFCGQGERDGDASLRQCIAFPACSPRLTLGFFGRSCPNPMLWCPAPLPAGKVELAAQPPRAAKDERRQRLLRVPLEQLATAPGLPEVLPSGKGSVAIPAGGLGGHQPGAWWHRPLGPPHIVCPIASSAQS